MKHIDYFETEKVNFNGFICFCKKNVPLLMAITTALLFSYGIKLFWHSIGVDTDLFSVNKTWFVTNWQIQIGRFGLSLLQKMLYIKEFNPFASTFIAICLIWLFAVSWCYVISVFGKSTSRNNRLIPFALLLLTVPVWAEIICFQFMSVENLFIVFLCPYVVYMFYRGLLENKWMFVIIALVLLVFMISVYQAVVPLFCCGVFICFVLLYENSDYDSWTYRFLCLKLFVALILALFVYSMFNRMLIDYIFKVERTEYLDEMVKWGKRPFGDNILNILVYGYKLTIGHIQLVQNMAGPIIASFARTGDTAARQIAQDSRILGNVFLLPVSVFFVIETIYSVRKRKGHSWLVYILAGIFIPLSIMFLPIMLGGNISVRQQFSLPLSFAFMMYYIIKNSKKHFAFFVGCIGIITAIYQAETTSQLFYTDHRRYQKDVYFSTDIDRMIRDIGSGATGDLPLALIGKYQPKFEFNYLYGDVIGYSSFGWTNPKDYYESTERGLAFMNSLGLNYKIPSEELMEKARDASKTMPNYPDRGCIKRLDDVIVLKISDSVYSQ